MRGKMTTSASSALAREKPATLGALKQSRTYDLRKLARSVKEEMRENLLQALAAKKPLFPGVHGYDDTVVPQIANALLSRHNFVLLGLRGQAKSRILRGLARFLDEEIPVLEGCEISDNPLRPICRACRFSSRKMSA